MAQHKEKLYGKARRQAQEHHARETVQAWLVRNRLAAGVLVVALVVGVVLLALGMKPLGVGILMIAIAAGLILLAGSGPSKPDGRGDGSAIDFGRGR